MSDDRTDLERTFHDRIVDLRPLVEVDIAEEIKSDLPSAVFVYWDGMQWLFLPLPGENELRVETTGYIDGKREHGPTDLILRRQPKRDDE